VSCAEGPYPAKTELHRLTPLQYAHAIRDIFDGRVTPSSVYPGAFGQSKTGYSTEQAVNAVGEQSTEELMNAAEEVSIEIAAALPELLPCSTGAADASCVATFLSSYGQRAYRRPLTDAEADALTATYEAARDAGASFTEGIAILSAHLLQSPQFLYWMEEAADDGRKLGSYELASRLSFFFWDSVPDDELLELSAADELADAQTLSNQAERLLASSKADATLARLLREWTQAKTIAASDKDAAAFPYFTSTYAAALNESFDRFASDQLRNQGTLRTLLTSTRAFVDATIAPSYGVPQPPQNEWQEVTLDETRYAGILSHPLLLATNAHSSTSSYVFRGRLLEKRLLCAEFGPPPANAQAAFGALPLPEDATAKEAAAAVEAEPACGGCHALLDPPGLAFEHFDGAGRYRETYDSGRAIDTSGTLELGSDSISFTSNVDLARALGERPELADCYARQVFRFTFSRAEREEDACTLRKIKDSLERSDGSLGEALLAVIATDAFSWRADP
jgi:hypothetical protein